MPGYETKTQRIAVTAQDDLLLRSLKDLQQFEDPDRAAGLAGISSATWPLFGHLWPSSRILTELLATLDLAGRKVLELGCGLAFPSLMMHRAGADVTASDILPEAGRLIAANIALNLLRPMTFHRTDWASEDLVLGRSACSWAATSSMSLGSHRVISHSRHPVALATSRQPAPRRSRPHCAGSEDGASCGGRSYPRPEPMVRSPCAQT